MNTPSFYAVLDHEGILSVQGADAAQFLQGQLTCDVKALSAETFSLGARCTPKGRMQSSFRILSFGEGFLLAMARELVEPQQQDLGKYAVFSKSTLADASADWVRIGLVGGDAALSALGLMPPAEPGTVSRAEIGMALRLDEQRTELWIASDAKAQVIEQLDQSLQNGSVMDWQAAQIAAGEGQVFGATREQFIPQMINLQVLLGGVSFKKGCYTGQEIVARTQYLGKVKRRMYRLAGAPGATLPAPGTKVFAEGVEAAVGEVVMAANVNQGMEVLAVLQEDASKSEGIKLDPTSESRLILQPLPYTLEG